MSHTNTDQNPLLLESNLLHGAFPFDRLKVEHFLPALEEAIRRAEQQIAEIKNSTASPTFENTILKLETAPEWVGRVAEVFFNLLSAESGDELQALAKVISPRLAEFRSAMTLDEKIFSKVKAVRENADRLGLHGEEWQLTEKTYRDFARNGGLLSTDDKEKLRAIDQEMAKLGPEYSDHVLKDTNAFSMEITDPAQLAGLPESALEAAKEAGKAAGKPDVSIFNLQQPSYVAFMTYADDRDLRQKMYMAFNSRAFQNAHSNEELCRRIAVLRFERAKLLGFASHAHFVLEERMASHPDVVHKFLQRLASKASPAAKRDLDAVIRFKKDDDKTRAPHAGDEFAAWDYTYYSEKLKNRDFDFDEELLRPYFKLENVIDGAFEHARKLFGVTFKPVTGIPVYHEDVKTFEVMEESTGKYVGLFYADFFPRKGKRAGAWMTSFQEQGMFQGKPVRPHVSIVCNFTQPTQTKPSLLNIDEVRTLFHEFGHALHGMLSQCKYTSLGGTNVYWDFVELPSQMMENWVLEKEALDLFARHYETGATIPEDLTQKIKATAKFQAGYFSMRQLSFSMLDMAWHSGDPSGVKDLEKFETETLSATQLLPRPKGICSSTAFSHIFAGGYSAGYYSYKWAEVLDADAFEYFKEKGLFNEEVAKKFKDNILTKGGSEHPMELYKRFRGREPDPDALLRRDGLI